MGRAKLTLPFGPETMLARVVRLLGEACEPVVVVAATDGPLPQLPDSVLLARDRRADRGPLEGLAAGLQTLGDRAAAAFVCACDVPLLLPQFVRRMVELSEGCDVAVPHIDGLHEPLAAVYHTSVLPHVDALLGEDRLRLAHLFDRVRTRHVTAEELSDVDPQLRSLRNVNSPAEYHAALLAVGLEAP